MTAAEMPADLTRVRDHSTDPVVDWLNGDTDVLDVQVVDETVEFTPADHIWTDVPDDAKPYGRPTPDLRLLPPVGWVPVDRNIGTPIFDQVQDGWSWRTVKGRKSRLDMSYDGFVAASRAQHSTWHGRQR
jgi:hypothetical protein